MQEMDLSKAKYYMGLQLDSWCKSTSFYCPIVAYLHDYKKTSGLLGACGHDTRELDDAIATADKAIENLKAVLERAVARFKAEDISLPIDELNHKEAKAARI
jgi:hypothetical protein